MLQDVDIARLVEIRGPLKREGEALHFGGIDGLRVDLSVQRFFDYDDESSGTLEDLADRYKLNGKAQEPVELHPALADERALLGMLLAAPDLQAAVEEEITGAEFIAWQHVALFAAIQESRAAGEGVRMERLLAGFEGEPIAFSGLTPAQYIARLIADAYIPPGPEDAAHAARELAQAVRRVAEEEGAQRPAEWPEDPNLPGPRQSSHGLVMYSDLGVGVAGEEYEFIVQALIPAGEPVLIYGESGSGKTYLTLDMAMCLARGVPFFGRRILQPLGVVYCAYEAGRGFKDRLRGYRNHYGLRPEDDIPFALLTQPPDLWNDPNHTGKLIEEIQWIAREKFKVPLGAVVIDTHNAATPGASEIDSKEIGVIINRYHAIRKATGASLWIVSHKNAEGRMRGNQQLYNRIETALDVSKVYERKDKELVETRDSGGHILRTVRVHKQREGRSGDQWRFILRSVEAGRLDAFGEQVTGCVPTVPGEGLDPAGTVSAQGTPFVVPPGYTDLKPNPREIFRALQTALDTVGRLPPVGVRAPDGVTAVQYQDWFDERLRQIEGTEPDQKKLRERVRKALEYARRLWVPKLIGFDAGWYWRTGRKVAGIDRPPEREPEPQTLMRNDEDLTDLIR